MGIKSEWTRRGYEKLLMKNVENTLRHHKNKYEKILHKRGRIYIRTKNPDEVASGLTRVFGISSVSPAKETSSDLVKIIKTSVKIADATIEKGSSFAVRCRRVGTHTYSSMDVCKEVGKQILTKLEHKDLHVNLNNPDFTITIEIRDAEAYVFAETLHGPGGFPLGSQPKVICLLSGGIDSPVACWLVMRRGCVVVPVYLDAAPFADEADEQRALDVARALFEWSIGYPRKVYVVPHGKNLDAFVRKAPRKITCLLCKRIMYRVAERIAERENAEGIVTGEAIGEQASQTITNLMVLNEVAAKYPIHRPLLGFDKVETENLARRIGTFDISTRKSGGCGGAPDQPSTRAKLDFVKEAEEKLDIKQLVEDSVERAKVITV